MSDARGAESSRIRSVSCGLDLSTLERSDAAGALSPVGAAAFDTAVRVAREAGARLHLLSALDLDAAAIDTIENERAAGRKTVADAALARLAELVARAKSEGVDATSAIASGAPATALLEDADRNGRDLIVAGTRERGFVARTLLGSTSLKLVRRAAQPVWIARTPLRPAPVVLATIELGEMAPRVVAAAARVAAGSGGTLHVLHVVDYLASEVLRPGAADAAIVKEYRKRKRDTAEAEVPKLVERGLAAAGVASVKHEVHLPDGDAAPTIVATAERVRADLVVLGSVRHGFVSGLMTGLGRTAEAVLGEVRASLLVLKPHADGK